MSQCRGHGSAEQVMDDVGGRAAMSQRRGRGSAEQVMDNVIERTSVS